MNPVQHYESTHGPASMFPLRCTVRNCSHRLEPEPSGKSLACESGHLFDRAKQGHWNLLQPQDKKSNNPGDRDVVVEARNRWLERGYMNGLVEALRAWTSSWNSGSQTTTVLDLGCGEGTFGKELFANANVHFCGIDLSRKAIRLAVRQWSTATWVLANADRELPADDGTVDGVLSLFGRRPASEINRVMKSTGQCIVAVPGEDDLVELRELTQGEGVRRSRCEAIAQQFNEYGLRLAEQTTWRCVTELEPDAIRDAMTMTYRAARHSEQARLDEKITTMNVTLSADLMLFEKFEEQHVGSSVESTSNSDQ